ncbi:MAG: DUF3073 domain-containing protein [Cellulomonas sp.]|uniref:DUF3073 domain-containing protein n=1 Tax=Cellulomonas gelida TaxID=1712 RepID=A0A4Y3KIP6_9CELL|nr:MULTISPECIES: DUF3073 domain-containing protein [Cellulomonas]KMM44707.1 hypothetical protein CWIS_14445 [Cellulomonas sp. A375-1]MCR6648578.1 DUF3073 domain-containing protein [Cellulomonas sp.]MCR6704522.1 DUF3073 domain-containing protein [Cellulomonas sp.]GEA84291.1 hypothetical protein CGE01nite_15420 [Cellulomonas gelida]GGL32507.1 hypothetical protein GCM10009774_23820 [Cellulomonas gelida]
MGRGRQKAKQTKVARELKYFSPDTNYRALEQELSTHVDPIERRSVAAVDTDDEPDDDYGRRWLDDDR